MRASTQVALGDRRVTRIGLGTNRLRDDADGRRFLRAAVDAGIDFIDTAHLYTDGESERAIGAALAPFSERLLVASKAGYRPGGGRPERLRAQIEESFERLGVERIGLYYLHRVDPETPIEESLGVLAQYREAGRIEQVGISQVSVGQIERARATVPIAAVQNEYNLGERRYEDVIDFCEREQIVFVPFFPLRGAGAARALARRYRVTPQQVALAWLLRRSPAIAPIPGTLSIEHLRQNLAALELELAFEDYGALATA